MGKNNVRVSRANIIAGSQTKNTGDMVERQRQAGEKAGEKAGEIAKWPLSKIQCFCYLCPPRFNPQQQVSW